MKKNGKTGTPLRVQPAALTKRELTAVVGGTGGTIISQNALPDLPETSLFGWGSQDT
jgi:hypothetical protein